MFVKKNVIYSGFYLKHCLLLAKFKFPARTANKTCLNFLEARLVKGRNQRDNIKNTLMELSEATVLRIRI